MAAQRGGYGPLMPSVKTRVAITGGKYLVTHPRSRLTRWVIRFVARRVGTRLARLANRGPFALRLVVVGWLAAVVAGSAVVAGGVAFVVRRRRRRAAAREAVAPLVTPPFPPSAATPPETRDAPSTTPTTSPASEAAALTAAAAVGDGDDAVVARVNAQLFGGTPPLGVTVESNSGVVTLRGQVADEEAEVRIVRDAERIEGVKAVQSELQSAGAEPGAPGD